MKPFSLVIVATLLLCLCCEAQAQDAAPFPAAPTYYHPAPEDPSGLTWGQVCVIIGSIIGGAGLGGGGVWMCRKTTIDPQPLAVSLEKEFATKAELDELNRKLDRETGKLSSRIDSMNTTLAEIKGELKGISSNLDKILGTIIKQ